MSAVAAIRRFQDCLIALDRCSRDSIRSVRLSTISQIGSSIHCQETSNKVEDKKKQKEYRNKVDYILQDEKIAPRGN